MDKTLKQATINYMKLLSEYEKKILDGEINKDEILEEFSYLKLCNQLLERVGYLKRLDEDYINNNKYKLEINSDNLEYYINKFCSKYNVKFKKTKDFGDKDYYYLSKKHTVIVSIEDNWHDKEDIGINFKEIYIAGYDISVDWKVYSFIEFENIVKSISTNDLFKEFE